MRLFPKTLLIGLLTLAVLGGNLILPSGAQAAAHRPGGNTAELKKIDHELEELIAAKKKKKKHHKKHHHKKHHHKKHHHHKKSKAASVRRLEQQLERDLGKKG